MREKLVGEIDFPKTPRRRVRHGQEFGESMDSDRYLARDPMAWDRSVRVETPRRTITIGVNLSVNCDVNGEEMMWRGRRCPRAGRHPPDARLQRRDRRVLQHPEPD